MPDFKKAELSDILGKILTKVEQTKGAWGDDALIFITDDGKRYKLYHQQDCCETVTIEDISGDLSDLVGAPIMLAEEATSTGQPTDITKPEINSCTWTFYKFATLNGYVDVRWYGESKGYYSERVNFEEF